MEKSVNPESIRKYITKLRMPVSIRPVNRCTPAEYIINMEQKTFRLHPDLNPTKIWTYNGIQGTPLLDVRKGEPITVKWVNKLPKKHLLERYIDHNVPGAGLNVPDVRTVVHLHGGEQSPENDGNPMDWYTKNQYTESYYPNEQHSTFLFWHDHAMGITRLNTYAGLNGGAYIIRDKQEEKLNLPCKKYELPLVLTDRIFSTNGDILFSNYEEPEPKWKATFMGNIPLVNNCIWPYKKVKRCKYRLRIVNASDTRTYTLVLGDNKSFTQIGTDGGFLPKPIKIKSLTLSVAERADIIIDFSDMCPGEELILHNTAEQADPETMGQLMKFIVCKSKGVKFNICVPKNFKYLNIKDVSVIRPLTLSADMEMDGMEMIHKALFLNNSYYMKDVTERPLVNSTEIWEFINMTDMMHPMHVHLIDFQLLNRQTFDLKAYKAQLIKQNPNFITQPGSGLLNPLSPKDYLNGSPIYPLETNEDGWKDVIRCLPGYVTRIIVKFSSRDCDGFPFDATKGTYVWHCHKISHEDNEMMRPFKLYNEI